MPFEGEHAHDIAMTLPEGPVCKFDCENGQLKSPDVIFMGGVMYFKDAVAGGDQVLAERLTRKNMSGLVYWQAHPFALLSGEQATDEEFAACMAKLM